MSSWRVFELRAEGWSAFSHSEGEKRKRGGKKQVWGPSAWHASKREGLGDSIGGKGQCTDLLSCYSSSFPASSPWHHIWSPEPGWVWASFYPSTKTKQAIKPLLLGAGEGGQCRVRIGTVGGAILRTFSVFRGSEFSRRLGSHWRLLSKWKWDLFYHDFHLWELAPQNEYRSLSLASSKDLSLKFIGFCFSCSSGHLSTWCCLTSVKVPHAHASKCQVEQLASAVDQECYQVGQCGTKTLQICPSRNLCRGTGLPSSHLPVPDTKNTVCAAASTLYPRVVLDATGIKEIKDLIPVLRHLTLFD